MRRETQSKFNASALLQSAHQGLEFFTAFAAKFQMVVDCLKSLGQRLALKRMFCKFRQSPRALVARQFVISRERQHLQKGIDLLA